MSFRAFQALYIVSQIGVFTDVVYARSIKFSRRAALQPLSDPEVFLGEHINTEGGEVIDFASFSNYFLCSVRNG